MSSKPRFASFLTFGFLSFVGAGMSAAGSITEPVPLQVIAVRDLDFGRFISGGPGQLTLNPHNATLDSSDPGRLVLLGGHAPARFDLRGEPGRTLELALPASILIQRSAEVSLRVDDLTMTARDAVTAESIPLSGWRLAIPPSGRLVVEIGGTLLVEGNGAAASSAASFTLSASYLPI